MDKKVSIIVPIYKSEKYLRKCLNSIVNQTSQEFLVHLVNDGSPDRSDVILNEYQEKYPDIFIVHNKENGGVATAWNYAIKRITTKYIIFIDADDYVEEQYVETLLSTAEKHNADIVECGHKRVYEKGDYNKVYHPFVKGVNTLEKNPDVICKIRVEVWGKIYKTELFIKDNIFYPEGYIREDSVTIPMLVARSKVVVGVEDCLYNYLQRSGSITTKFDERIYLLYDLAKLIGNDSYAEIYPVQFEYCQIRRILLLISKLAEFNMDEKEINKAYHYLEMNIPDWKSNNVYIQESKNSKVSIRMYYYLIERKKIKLLKLHLRLRKKKKNFVNRRFR